MNINKKLNNNFRILYKLSIPRLANLIEINVENLSNIHKQNVEEETNKKVEYLIKFGREIVINLKRYAVSDIRLSMISHKRKINRKSMVHSIICNVITFLMSTLSVKHMIKDVKDVK